MKGKALTVAQASAAILTLQGEIRRGADFRYSHRLHAVLLVAQGMSCVQVAELFGDGARTVEYWVHRFEANGLAGLGERARQWRPTRLTPEQVAEIHYAIGTRPRDFGSSGDSLNAKILAAYIERTYGVKLGARQCSRLLRRWFLGLAEPRRKHR